MSTYFGQSTIEAIVKWWRWWWKKEETEKATEKPKIIRLASRDLGGTYSYTLPPFQLPRKIAKRMRKMGGAKE